MGMLTPCLGLDSKTLHIVSAGEGEGSVEDVKTLKTHDFVLINAMFRC